MIPRNRIAIFIKEIGHDKILNLIMVYGEVTSLGNGSLNTVPASITGTGTFKPEFAKLLLNLTVQLFAYVN